MFSEPSCVWIFANGQQVYWPVLAQRITAADHLIAADGGLRFLRQMDRWPQLLIGDLDSLEESETADARIHGVEIRQYPTHKDETDLELAIFAALALDPQNLCMRIAAAVGGRLDMTLGNIGLLLLPELRAWDVRLDDGYEEVFLIRPGDDVGLIDGQPGETVSLLPWGGAAGGVTTDGLAYPLHDETLYPERTRGISNVMQTSQARVTVKTGLLVCIHTWGMSHA